MLLLCNIMCTMNMHKCNFLQFTYLLFAIEYAPKCNQKIEYANYIEADTVIYLRSLY